MSACWVARPDTVEKVTQLSPIDSPGRGFIWWPRLSPGEWGGRIRSMNWLRSKIQSWTWLALFALTLQMAVSFGHMHRDELGLPPAIKAGQALALTDATGSPAGPADEDHHPAPDHYCPICASIALIGTGAPALAPVLIVPIIGRPLFPVRKAGGSATATNYPLVSSARTPNHLASSPFCRSSSEEPAEDHPPGPFCLKAGRCFRLKIGVHR